MIIPRQIMKGNLEKLRILDKQTKKICHREYSWCILELLLKSFMDSCQFWRKEYTMLESVGSGTRS